MPSAPATNAFLENIETVLIKPAEPVLGTPMILDAGLAVREQNRRSLTCTR
jgi:hypothetical protein